MCHCLECNFQTIQKTQYEKEQQDQIHNMEATMQELEKILNKTTARYANLVNEEKHRLETSKHVTIQFSPNMTNAETQVDFVLSMNREDFLSRNVVCPIDLLASKNSSTIRIPSPRYSDKINVCTEDQASDTKISIRDVGSTENGSMMSVNRLSFPGHT